MSKITNVYDREVKQFTDAMKYKLHVNQHKGRWEGATLDGLFTKLLEEVQELKAEIGSDALNQTAIMLEAADIGNMAMMIANIAIRMAAGEAISMKPYMPQEATVAAIASGVSAASRAQGVIGPSNPRDGVIATVPRFLMNQDDSKIDINEVRHRQAPELKATMEQVKEAVKL